MTQARPLPTLFGRFTTVIQAHRDLAPTLALLRRMCATIEDGQELLDELSPPLLLRRLHADLNDHFALEEADSYFGTVVDEVPALAGQIDVLKIEHATLLGAAHALCALALDQARWPHLPHPIRELLGTLERHERAESALLRQMFREQAE